jgi:uncharacterized protein YciI
MLQFTKPLNLNGAELLQELNAAGILITTNPMLDGDGNLWLDVLEKDKNKAAEIVGKHNGTTIAPEPTLKDKLVALGLSTNDLADLGL